MEKINYKGWPSCYRLSNDLVDLILTTDVGPRVIRFGFIGDANEFKEYPDMVGKTGGTEWRIYGGHRLWHSPEGIPRSYFPDNSPVAMEQHGRTVRLIQPVETTTGIQKEMDIELSPTAASVRVTHRLRNTNLWTVQLSAWALSCMAPGGRAIIPLPPRCRHEENLQPSNSLTLWHFTDLTDPRWTLGRKYIMLRQDPAHSSAQEIGAMDMDSWLGYANNGHLFVKQFTYVPGAAYPDFGCSVETFTNGDMLEAETLSPLTNLEPGATMEHVERWSLCRNVPEPNNDADVDKFVLPKVKELFKEPLSLR